MNNSTHVPTHRGSWYHLLLWSRVYLLAFFVVALLGEQAGHFPVARPGPIIRALFVGAHVCLVFLLLICPWFWFSVRYRCLALTGSILAVAVLIYGALSPHF